MRNLGLGLLALGLVACGPAFAGSSGSGLADGGAGSGSAGGSIDLAPPTAGAPSGGHGGTGGVSGAASGGAGSSGSGATGGAGCVPKKFCDGSYSSANCYPSDDHHCGSLPDGCGGVVTNIFGCGNGTTCAANNVCTAPCVPKTICTAPNVPAGCYPKDRQHCGTLPDGCGGVVTSPFYCGNGNYCAAATNECVSDLGGLTCPPETPGYEPQGICIAVQSYGISYCDKAPLAEARCVWSPTATSGRIAAGCWICPGAT